MFAVGLPTGAVRGVWSAVHGICEALSIVWLHTVVVHSVLGGSPYKWERPVGHTAMAPYTRSL